jgi:hypothetical protein
VFAACKSFSDTAMKRSQKRPRLEFWSEEDVSPIINDDLPAFPISYEQHTSDISSEPEEQQYKAVHRKKQKKQKRQEKKKEEKILDVPANLIFRDFIINTKETTAFSSQIEEQVAKEMKVEDFFSSNGRIKT